MEPHIALTRFRGYNGGFATSMSTLYRVEVVGPTGVRGYVPCGPMANSESIPIQEVAERVAQYWSDITGWPVHRFRETMKNSPVIERE